MVEEMINIMEITYEVERILVWTGGSVRYESGAMDKKTDRKEKRK